MIPQLRDYRTRGLRFALPRKPSRRNFSEGGLSEHIDDSVLLALALLLMIWIFLMKWLARSDGEIPF
jgi:hypothetical protein